MQLGIIADDFTGATDAAGFLVAAGVRTTLLVGVPREASVETETGPHDASDAVVISLKSRSCPAEQAVRHSSEALDWLQKHGAHRIYQKYCSTFDSTCKGNIGPVADALMDRLRTNITVICPALPVNGRTIYHGYLFVNGTLLAETGMRHHPITPMTDSHLGRLMGAQARGHAGVVSADVVEAGSDAVRTRVDTLADEGTTRFVVAGGETAGAIVEALGVVGFHVGPQIAPGVPWVRSLNGDFSMALKSGNFGTEDFFFVCQSDPS